MVLDINDKAADEILFICHLSQIYNKKSDRQPILSLALISNDIKIEDCKLWNASTINSNITSFFRFVDKRAIYLLGIISLAHAPVHVTDFSVVNVHVDELSSARIWQHKLCATFSTYVNINYPSSNQNILPYLYS